VHQRHWDQAVLALAQQVRQKMGEVSDQRGRGALQLDIVVFAGAHFKCRGGGVIDGNRLEGAGPLQ
jgi:hypothetical protein